MNIFEERIEYKPFEYPEYYKIYLKLISGKMIIFVLKKGKKFLKDLPTAVIITKHG